MTRTPRQSSTIKFIGIVALLLFAVLWSYLTRPAEAAPLPDADIDTAPLLTAALPQSTPSQTLDYEGFTLSYNPSHRLPNYVAWELTPSEATADQASRKSQKFRPDKRAENSPTTTDYTGSGYARGHMCPAADLKWSSQAMYDSFYMTNVCPQDTRLNGGAWGKLEQKCREWARRDSSLIIIAGPVLADRITAHIGPDSDISVPQRFFKIVYAPYARPPRAIAFIFPNTRPDGGFMQYATTVDDAEAITGLDFLAALPDSIEAPLEAQADILLWTKTTPTKNKR